MLNTTKVELEFISDSDMYLFFEKGMRSGVSYISKRYVKVNNKYLRCYDAKQESKDIYLTQIICMVMRCLNFFEQAKYSRINTAEIVRKIVC